VVVAAAAVFAAGFTLFAQNAPPAPAGTAGVPATAAPAEATTQAGREGRGGGRNPNALADFSPRDPIPPRTAADQAKTFVLPPGYRMELVVAEPSVISPTIIEFDGNGRMYVAEFLSYMLDADGTGSHDPISRITRFESTRGDGVYDKRTVFADKLVLPRAILPLEDGVILTNETASDDLIRLSDTNGDGVADRKEVVYTGVGLGRDGNLEHEQMGFLWGLDNWIYSTYNAFRLRWTPRGFLREPTGSNGAQWGVSQDDDGKIWWLCGGCERGPINFQIPILYGAWTRDGQFEPGFDTAWPLVGVGDVQGGMGRVRIPTNVLNHLTGTSGVDVVRGDRVPDDLRGDLLFGEPVGRFVRRARIVKTEGLTELRNVYPNSEFILSSDLYFRPVNVETAPDGTVYIADMYHGIIQDSQWTLPGSYLRRRIEQYQLDKVINFGRIWRLRYDGLPAVPPTPAQPAAAATPGSPAVPGIALDVSPPRMYSETPAALVAHLAHPNGWWRDTAQRLLVLRQDRSVVPALRQMIARPEPIAGRIHALWTLEGLGALDAGLVRELMADANPRLRVQAIRASETLYKAGNRTFDADYRRLTSDADADVAIQALLTLSLFKVADLPEVVTTAQAANSTRGVQEVGAWITRPAATGRGGGRGGPTRTPEQLALLTRGETIFNEVCFACHGADGRGQPLGGGEPGETMAPSLAGSPRVQGHRDYVIRTLLHGLTGPIDGRTYAQVMAPLGSNPDEWIAAAGSFIRTSFGNTASLITPSDVARVRKMTAGRRTMWTPAEIEAALPVLLMPQPTWKATASHNTEIAAGALSLAGWTAAVPQQAGMWIQVELPEPIALAEIQFNSPAGGRGFGIGSLGGYGTGRGVNQAGAPGGGGRGRGGAPPAGLHPIAYRVQVSMDGKTWSRPVAEGAGLPDLTTIPLTPIDARFVRITQTATPTGPDVPVWSMIGLRLYVAPRP
jgi:mono/diheme cytochrome c family protein/glucose/arabinose dehydrogenase